MNRILLELDSTGYVKGAFIMADDDGAAAVCVKTLQRLVGWRTFGWLRRLLRRR